MAALPVPCFVGQLGVQGRGQRGLAGLGLACIFQPAHVVEESASVPVAVVEGVIPQVIVESLAEGLVELDETVDRSKETAKKKLVKKPVVEKE